MGVVIEFFIMSSELKKKYIVQREFYSKHPDVYINWKYYHTSFIHCILYVIIFFCTYYQTATCYINYYYIHFLIYSCISGWSIFGLISIGHDACHKSLCPHQTKLGNFLNQFFSWLLLDCLAMSSFEWSKMHWEHDHYGIFGTGIPKKYYGPKGILISFYDLLCADWRRIINRNIGWKRLCLGIIIRYILYFYCGLIPFIFNTISALMWMNIFFNIPHVNASKYINYGNDKNIMIIICQQTWDIMPSNYIMSFISFGLNAHATHHCFPTIPRYLHGSAANILETHLDWNYKKCVTWTHYLQLVKQYGDLYLQLCGLNTYQFRRKCLLEKFCNF
eukprot:272079_1